VIASDVLYEPRNVDTLLALLPRLVDKKGRVLIADPGRSPAEEFFERAAAGRWHVRTTSSSRSPRVWIHRLRLR
jgi:predicted nicotinamide N-methyase